MQAHFVRAIFSAWGGLRPICKDAASTIKVYIDADACPVKEETYKVAARDGLQTFVVSKSCMRIPLSPPIAKIIVGAGANVADDCIAEQIVAGDWLVTNYGWTRIGKGHMPSAGSLTGVADFCHLRG
jgi:hypothetical protein